MEKATKPSGQQTQDSPSSPKSPCFRACLILAECLKLCRVTWNSEVMVCPSPAARSPASIEAEVCFVLPQRKVLPAQTWARFSRVIHRSASKWAAICYLHKVVKTMSIFPLAISIFAMLIQKSETLLGLCHSSASQGEMQDSSLLARTKIKPGCRNGGEKRLNAFLNTSKPYLAQLQADNGT